MYALKIIRHTAGLFYKMKYILFRLPRVSVVLHCLDNKWLPISAVEDMKECDGR